MKRPPPLSSFLLLCLLSNSCAATPFHLKRSPLPVPLLPGRGQGLPRPLSLAVLPNRGSVSSPLTSAVREDVTPSPPGPGPGLSALSKRVATGLLLSLLWSPLCFAGTPIFAVALLVPLIQALREFHFFLDRTAGLGSVGFAIGVSSTVVTVFTACYHARLHPYTLPLAIVALLLQMLFAKTDITPTSDITSSAFSIMYIGYFMSFWVRLLDIKAIHFNNLPRIQLGPLSLTSSSFLLWWTFAIISSADIGGYVVGKGLGSRAHPFSQLAGVAAGKASPHKTVEGVLGGMFFAVLTTLIGVVNLRPQVHTLSSNSVALGYVFSLLYGCGLALLALTSDLSVSLWKRNAGVKDSWRGHVLPGHGGVLDRMDSYLLTGPVVYAWWSWWGGT